MRRFSLIDIFLNDIKWLVILGKSYWGYEPQDI